MYKKLREFNYSFILDNNQFQYVLEYILQFIEADGVRLANKNKFNEYKDTDIIYNNSNLEHREIILDHIRKLLSDTNFPKDHLEHFNNEKYLILYPS